MKIAVMADSSSGITQKEAKELGVYVAPVPLYIDGELFYEDLTVTQEEFYKRLKNGASVSTSQPNPSIVSDAWKKALETCDAVIYVPISSGFSQTGHFLAQIANNDERFKDKVFVVDNYRVSATQRQAVIDALKMSAEGKTAKEIYDFLTATKMQSSLYITVDTLKYLKKSGRITPAVAAIGTLLKIKPVLKSRGNAFDTLAKVRKFSDAKSVMINALKKDLNSDFTDIANAKKIIIGIAYTDNLNEAKKFKAEVLQVFPDVDFAYFGPLPLSVASHVGNGALALGCAAKY